MRAEGAPDTEAANLSMLKLLDCCTGVRVIEPCFSNGGQLIDVTYVASNSENGPCLDNVIEGGLFRGSNESAVTDHPGNLGTVVRNNVFQHCWGAVYIRSREAQVYGNRAQGIGGTGIGIWAGENGYWSGLTSSNNFMSGFATGYTFAGSNSNITRRDTMSQGDRASRCGTGMLIASGTDADQGFRSIGFRADRITNIGIDIDGTPHGLDISGFQIRGPVATCGIRFDGSVKDVSLHGDIIDLGANIPPILVAEGTPARINIDISYRGTVDYHGGITETMIQLTPRVLYTSAGNLSLTGTTSESLLKAEIGIIPPGAGFGLGARVEVRVLGTITGTAGTKLLRVKFGTTQFINLTLPAALSGAFDAKFTAVSLGEASQRVFSSYIADVSGVDPSGPTNRTVDTTSSGTLNFYAALANSADALEIYSIETTGVWA